MGSMMGRHHRSIMSMEPTPEQVKEWLGQALSKYEEKWGEGFIHASGTKIGIVAGEVARLAYRAGDDDRLEACVRSLQDQTFSGAADQLRSAMRPKSPSLKQQALEHLGSECFPYTESISIIREALESLPDC
jgi:hypothetical protein